MSDGTPKTLDEAIANAVCIGPLSGVTNRIYLHIRDFMAQKFGPAYLRAEGKELENLQRLFEELTRREE